MRQPSQLPANHPRLAAGLSIAKISAASVLLLIGCQSAPAPYYPGDAVEGKLVAEQLCASCHAIGGDGLSPHPAAPPFGGILEKYDEASLTKDLDNAVSISHLRMPTFYLSDNHAEDIVAYLKSIERPKSERER
jgi:mono/diheme cytochrome c family protein